MPNICQKLATTLLPYEFLGALGRVEVALRAKGVQRGPFVARVPVKGGWLHREGAGKR